MSDKIPDQRNNGNTKNRFKFFLKLIVVISITTMIMLVFINAALRYLFNRGFPASEELARFFFIWTIFLGIIVAYKEGDHVSVTILTDGLKGKTKILVNILSQISSFIAMIVILMGRIKYTMMSTTYKSVATEINFALISVSIVVMSFGVILLMIKNIYNTIKHKKS